MGKKADFLYLFNRISKYSICIFKKSMHFRKLGGNKKQ